MNTTDLGALAVAAASYAIGRSTFGTDTVIDWLEANITAFDPDTRCRLAHLIARYDVKNWLGRPAARWCTLAATLVQLTGPATTTVTYEDRAQRRIIWTSAFRHDTINGDTDAPRRWADWCDAYPDVLADCRLTREYALVETGPAWDMVRDRLTVIDDRIDAHPTPINGGDQAKREGWT